MLLLYAIIHSKRSHICHALSFQKHLLIICTSERSERALRIIFHVWKINVFLLRYYPFQKKSHLSRIILSETFTYNMHEWAKRASAQNHCVFSFLTDVTGKVRFISQYTCTLFSEQYHVQVDVKAKISLCQHCLINYFGISLLSLIMTFSAHFYHCRYHAIAASLFIYLSRGCYYCYHLLPFLTCSLAHLLSCSTCSLIGCWVTEGT